MKNSKIFPLIVLTFTIFIAFCLNSGASEINYDKKVVNYISTKDFISNFNENKIKNDLLLFRKLNADSVRIFVSPLDIQKNSTYKNLSRLFYICRETNLNIEISLFENWDDYSSIDKSKIWLKGFLNSISSQKNITLINLKRNVDFSNPESKIWVKELFNELKTQKRQNLVSMSFNTIAELKQIKELNIEPDIYLYNFSDEINKLNNNLKEIKNYIEPKQLQLSLQIRNEKIDEHEQAWFYRFMFYFSRKYNLINPSSSYLDLIRTDSTIKPSFITTQIFYQNKKIDIDEKKLTRELFEEKPENYFKLSNDPEEFLKSFLKIYYKTTEQGDSSRYINKDSKAFYTYLKSKSEESLINSNYASLDNIEIIKKVNTNQEIIIFTRLKFLSSIGVYDIKQTFSIKRTDSGLNIEDISEPEEVFDFNKYEISKKISLPINIPTDKNLSISISINKDDKNVILWFNIKNNSPQNIDIKTIQISEKTSKKVFIPSPGLLNFYKHILPGNNINGFIIFKHNEKEIYNFDLKYSKSIHNYQLLRLNANFFIKSNNETFLNIFNNNFEKAILPNIYIFGESNEQKNGFQLILSKNLLPMEKRQIKISHPEQWALVHCKNSNHFTSCINNVQVSGNFNSFPDYYVDLDTAYRYKLMNNDKEALKKYSRILVVYKNSIPKKNISKIQKEILFLYMKTGDYKKSEKIIDSIILTYPNDLLLYKAKISILKNLKKTDEFENVSLKTIQMFPNDKDTYKNLYSYYSESGNFNKSLNLINRAIKIFPNDFDIYNAQGFAYKKMGNKNSAIKSYLKANEIFPKDIISTEMLFYLNKDINNNITAISFLKKLILLTPKTEYYKELGYLYKISGKTDLAIRSYKKYLEKIDDPDVNLTLAGLYVESKNYSEAKKLYLRYISKHKDSTPPYKDLAYVYKETGDYENAVRFYEKFYLSNKNDHTILKDLGFLYMKSGNYNKSINSFETYKINTNNQELNVDLTLAFLYRQTKRFKEALNIYFIYLKKDPENINITKSILFSYIESNNLKEGINFINRIKLTNKTDPEIYYAMAQIYMKTGNFEKALEFLSISINRSKNENFYYYMLISDCYEQLGKIDLSIEYLRKADNLIIIN